MVQAGRGIPAKVNLKESLKSSYSIRENSVKFFSAGRASFKKSQEAVFPFLTGFISFEDSMGRAPPLASGSRRI